jgi:membrane-bound serine protease (ClpP class)
VVGTITGVINPVTAGYVDRVIDEAERTNAAAVVFTLDTPGGLSDATREITQRFLAARVPIVVYVAPEGARAGSAGVYITYAAHVAAMAPATNIGSATPVALGEGGQETQMSDEMKAKVTNDAVAGIRALAEQHGRDATFAERAVREGANVEASAALRIGIVNVMARDLPDLLRQTDGVAVRTASGEVTLRTADAEVQRLDMSAVEQFLLVITNPTIAYLLLSLGGLGIILELYNPGSIFPGVVGAISLVLAFFGLGTLPVNYAGLGLLAFGLALVALEPFITSHGILGAGGAVAFVVGSLLLLTVPDTAPYLRISVVAIAATGTVVLLVSVLVLGALLRARRRPVSTGREALVGTVATARLPIRPGEPGLVQIQGELWRAVAADAEVPPGGRVVVESVEGLLLRVRPLLTEPRTQTDSASPDVGRAEERGLTTGAAPAATQP